MLNRLVITSLILIGIEARAQAYIDPGTGALILQAIVAGFLGAVYFFRQRLARLMSLFRGKDTKGEGPADK